MSLDGLSMQLVTHNAVQLAEQLVVIYLVQ